MTQPPPPAFDRPAPYPAGPTGVGPDFGRVGFVIALVLVGLSVLQQIVFAFLPTIQSNTGVGFDQVSALIGVFAVIHGVISIAALIFGILGASRRRSPVLSGIAIGIGGAGTIAAFVGIAIVPIIGFMV